MHTIKDYSGEEKITSKAPPRYEKRDFLVEPINMSVLPSPSKSPKLIAFPNLELFSITSPERNKH
jgi:hypothetical protein